MSMFGTIVCWWKGKHKRGVRLVADKDAPPEVNEMFDSLMGTVAYRCPRCGATWARKTRKRSPKVAHG